MDDDRRIARRIRRSPAEVCAFAADPRNLPRWASGLAGGIEPDGQDWIADSPMGRVRVRFAPPNDAGILDHDVVLPGGEIVRNMLRVNAAPEGAEIAFTLRRREGMTDADLDRDAAWVARDLDALRSILEG